MFHSLGMKPKRKHFFDKERLAAVLKQKGSPLPNASRSAPDGYWFVVAQALSGFKHPSSKYINALYKYWFCTRDHMESICIVGEALIDHKPTDEATLDHSSLPAAVYTCM